MASSTEAKVFDPQSYPTKARDIQSALRAQYPTSPIAEAVGNLLVEMANSLSACDAELQKYKNPRANTPTV